MYLISIGNVPRPLECPARLREGWDVAEIMFFAGGYGNAHDNREDLAHWRIHTLSGLSYGWKPGTWIKGPLKVV